MKTRSITLGALSDIVVRPQLKTAFVLIALAFSVGLPLEARAQRVPESSGETLAGGSIRTPEVFGQRPAVVVAAFTRKASADARSWTKALSLDDELRGDQGVYGLFMVERVPRPLRGFVVRSISNEVPAMVRSHYIALEEHEKLWRDLLHVTSQDEVYVFVVDARGLLVWQTHGQYSAGAALSAKDAFQRAERNRLQALHTDAISASTPARSISSVLSGEDRAARTTRKPTR